MKNTILIIALLSFGAVCSAADTPKANSAAASVLQLQEDNLCAARQMKIKAGQACKRGDKDDGREWKVRIIGAGIGKISYSGEKIYKQECKNGKWEFSGKGIKCFDGYKAIGDEGCIRYEIVAKYTIGGKGMIMPKEGIMGLNTEKYSAAKAGQLCADSADESLKNERNLYMFLPNQNLQADKIKFIQCRLQKDNKWHTEIVEIKQGCSIVKSDGCNKDLVLRNRKSGDLCGQEEEGNCIEYNDPKFNDAAQCKKGYLQCVKVSFTAEESC